MNKPEKAKIDLRIAGKVVQFTLFNIDDPYFLAYQILQQYQLPFLYKEILVNKFMETYYYLRQPELSSKYLTLEPPVSSFISENFKQQLQEYTIQCSLLQSQNSNNTDKQITTLLSKRPARCTPNKGPQYVFSRTRTNNYEIYDKLYNEAKTKQQRAKEQVEQFTNERQKLSKSYLDNLIKRLSKQSNKHKSDVVERPDPPEVYPKTEMTELSRQLTENHHFSTSLKYYISSYCEQNRINLLKETSNYEIRERLLKYMKEGEYQNYIQYQISPQRSEIIANCLVSSKNDSGRITYEIQEQKCPFYPSIDKTSSIIGSCKYLEPRRPIERKEKLSDNAFFSKPLLVSRYIYKSAVYYQIIEQLQAK